MQAAIVHSFSAPPRVGAFADPRPEPGERLVRVLAAGLHPLVKALAGGAHYGTPDVLPFVPGVDGVGELDDGTRVYFGAARPPYGTFAERTVIPASWQVPLPAALATADAAALFNPGLSAWLALRWRGRLAAGETVLVLGATGVAGQLAVRLAKHFGAGRVIAAGRDPQRLKRALERGADAVVHLDRPDQEVADAVRAAAGDAGLHVIVDYLWGRPTEVVLRGVLRTGLTHSGPPLRLVEVGESAGPTIALSAAVLRSSGLEIVGSGAGSIPIERMAEAVPAFLTLAATGALDVEVEEVPLAAIGEVWQRHNTAGRRIVVLP